MISQRSIYGVKSHSNYNKQDYPLFLVSRALLRRRPCVIATICVASQPASVPVAPLSDGAAALPSRDHTQRRD